MKYLDIDLKSVCWSKLDYSRVNDLSKVTLLDKPILFDSIEEKIEFGNKYKHYAMYNVVGRIGAVICYTDKVSDSGDGLLEIGNIILPNLDKLNFIFKSKIMII